MTRSVRRLVDALPAIGLVILSILGAGGPASSEDAGAGDAVAGKRLFIAVGCFECHGRVGQGGAYITPAPVVAKTALPLEAFIAFIREPSADMPAYVASVLPDKGATDIYAYLQSLSGPRAVRDVPLLAN